MPEKNPAPSTEGDDRGEMQNQVLELAQVFATPEKRAAYLKEVEEKEAQEFRQRKAKERKERGGDHNPMAGVFSELIGGVIASASWLLAGVAVLAVVGGGAWFFTSRHANAPQIQPPVSNAASPAPTLVATAIGPAAVATAINPSALATSVSPAAVATAVSQVAASKTPPAGGLNGAQTSAAIKVLASLKNPGTGGSGQGATNPASIGSSAAKSGAGSGLAGTAHLPGSPNQKGAKPAPASGTSPAAPSVPPSALASMDKRIDPSMANLPPNLKKLWIEGADAKHRGDYAGARRAWNLALKIDPSHYGFQESIDKLPKA